MIFSRPTPLTEALQNSLARRVLALSSAIGTAEIQRDIPQAIRDRAFFSARTPYAGYLAETQADIQRALQPDTIVNPDGSTRPAGPGESLSGAQIRALMKERLAALDYRPAAGEEGSLTDLSSDRRTNLIIETQLAQVRNFGWWKQGLDPAILDAYPAQELYRALDREQPRIWQVRWNAAKAALGRASSATYAETTLGPFVALKDDPIWRELSAFGNPYPPFDFNSGMRTRDVARARAISLGVMDPDQPAPKPDAPEFNSPEIREIPSTVPSSLATVLRKVFAAYLQSQG